MGYVRRNFLVPVPSFESFDALNAYLEQRCLERMDAQLRGHTETIGQRMERDLDALLPLPPVAYDACDKQASRVSSLSLVRYRTNDYSVPVAYGHRDVLVRGYVDEVVISCGTEVIASHPRSYERDDFVYDPIHYLPLLERKPGALDQAAPLQGWDLPDEFGTLRRLLESRMGRRGKREFVQVLRLLETLSQLEVHAAVKDAIHLGSLSFDAVKHLVLCRLEGRPDRRGHSGLQPPPRHHPAASAAGSAGGWTPRLAGHHRTLRSGWDGPGPVGCGVRPPRADDGGPVEVTQDAGPLHGAPDSRTGGGGQVLPGRQGVEARRRSPGERAPARWSPFSVAVHGHPTELGKAATRLCWDVVRRPPGWCYALCSTLRKIQEK